MAECPNMFNVHVFAIAKINIGGQTSNNSTKSAQSFCANCKKITQIGRAIVTFPGCIGRKTLKNIIKY
jgi:hypothetical protein